MTIGIAMGILMNSYMPRQTAAIRADQRRIEELMRLLLGDLADSLLRPGETLTADRLRELEALLQVSRKRAFAHRDNSFNRDMDYYARYMEMRWEQYRILERLFLARDRLTEVSRPAYLVANFMRTMALSLHEYNNAQDLLQELTLIRRHFQSGELPVTRREFENRAVLYEIVFELRQLLLLKQGFAASLTPSQIRLFWKEAPFAPAGTERDIQVAGRKAACHPLPMSGFSAEQGKAGGREATAKRGVPTSPPLGYPCTRALAASHPPPKTLPLLSAGSTAAGRHTATSIGSPRCGCRRGGRICRSMLRQTTAIPCSPARLAKGAVPLMIDNGAGQR